MKMISIDVGIKNLSFCLFDDEQILFWDNINLMESELNNADAKCHGVNKKGKVCGAAAKFCVKGSSFFCARCCPKSVPTIAKKPSIVQLRQFCEANSVPIVVTDKKADLEKKVNEWLKTNGLTAIEKKNAAKTDLVTIGRNIQKHFDTILTDVVVDTVIIENQIGPIANKMKTIQGMLAQYFIMRNENVEIEFISASNKLKAFLPQGTKTEYKQRKKLSVEICEKIVKEKYPTWLEVLANSKKKDDLCDCFLQGLWYAGAKPLHDPN